MKILAITHLFPNEGNRNDGIFAARQLAEMRRQGADITVLVPVVWCPRVLSKLKRWSIYNHTWRHEYGGIQAVTIPYVRLPGRWYRTAAHRSVYYAIRRRVIQLHEDEPFDVIYARFLHPEGYAAVRLSKTLGIPVVGVGAGDEVNVYPNESRLYRTDFFKIVRQLDGVIASGHGVAAKLESVGDKKALAVHGVVDLQEFCPAKDKDAVRVLLGLPRDKQIILYAGTYKAAKGLYDLVDAVERASRKAPTIVLKVCGYGREEAGLRRVIKQKGLEQTIEMVGLVDPGQIHKWMQAADLFVLPSHAEGMPNAVMEAMACGLPVVATSVGGLPEEVGDCDGVILIEPKQVAALEQAILGVVQDDRLRARMAVAARERAEERFGVRRNARMVMDYTEDVVRKARLHRNTG